MAPNGSFKELIQALNAFIVNCHLPLPDDLLSIIDAFYAKHEPYEENDAEHVQEALKTLWEKHVLDSPERYPAFLAVFTRLIRCIHTTDRIFFWWDLILKKMSSQLVRDRNLQFESYQATLQLLMAEVGDDEGAKEEAGSGPKPTPFLDKLLNIWFSEHIRDLEDPYQQLEKQERSVLVSFGKKKPKHFMICLDKFFVKAESRRKCLILLSYLLRTETPHLHSVIQTPLFGNLLKCLENDTSTTVINLALTVLIMFLPTIPTQLVTYLPTLFNIYARLLFWDSRRTESNDSAAETQIQDHPLFHVTSNGTWDRCHFDATKDGSEITQLRNYFTMLYGLYPINFMDYIRKPERYLRHANALGTSPVEVQSTEIRQRSESFRRSHILHPNFYSLTIESEKTDFSRWMSSEVAELVADCMSLCTLSYETMASDAEADVTFLVETNKPLADTLLSRSLPDLALGPIDEAKQMSVLENDKQEETTDDSKDEQIPEEALEEQESSQDPDSKLSAPRKALPIDKRPPSSVSIPITRSDGNPSPSDLEHQIIMLENELCFEKYLKQQHAAHIGVLRRRLHQQAASEAETQHLLITNRNYKHRVEEAKKAEALARHDSERGRALSMKRETDMMAKNRTLREDIKAKKAEIEKLTRDVEAYKTETDRLTKLMCTLEEKELAHKQAQENMEAVDEEIKKLKGEVSRLGRSAGDAELRAAIKARDEAEAREEQVKLLLKGCQNDLERQRRDFDAHVTVLKQRLAEKKWPIHSMAKTTLNESKVRESISAALSASRSKQTELQKQYSILVRKYTALQSSMFDAPLPSPVPILGPPPASGARRAFDEESLGSISRTNSGDVVSPTSGYFSPEITQARAAAASGSTSAGPSTPGRIRRMFSGAELTIGEQALGGQNPRILREPVRHGQPTVAQSPGSGTGTGTGIAVGMEGITRSGTEASIGSIRTSEPYQGKGGAQNKGNTDGKEKKGLRGLRGLM